MTERQGRRLKQLLYGHKEKEKLLDIERGSIRLHSGENWLRKRLLTYSMADCVMCKFAVNIFSVFAFKNSK